MAQSLNLLLVVVVVLAKKNEAFGGNEEKLERLQGKQNRVSGNQRQPSYNENLDELVALLKTDTLKALCESGKVNPIWCQYKNLLELNTAYEQHQKSVKKKSSGSLCWPGLPLPCKGLIPARNARDVENENDYETNNEFDNGSDYDTHYDTENVNEIENDADNYVDIDNGEEKRAMKCRPGMVNCRRKKKGKRTVEATKPKVCPQGWMFCF